LKVELSSRARSDLVAIGNWIARDDRSMANKFVDKLIDACEEIGTRPNLYSLVHGRRTLRKRLYRGYLIFYRVRRRDVFIVSVRHGARDNSALR